MYIVVETSSPSISLSSPSFLSRKKQMQTSLVGVCRRVLLSFFLFLSRLDCKHVLHFTSCSLLWMCTIFCWSFVALLLPQWRLFVLCCVVLCCGGEDNAGLYDNDYVTLSSETPNFQLSTPMSSFVMAPCARVKHFHFLLSPSPSPFLNFSSFSFSSFFDYLYENCLKKLSRSLNRIQNLTTFHQLCTFGKIEERKKWNEMEKEWKRKENERVLREDTVTEKNHSSIVVYLYNSLSSSK